MYDYIDLAYTSLFINTKDLTRKTFLQDKNLTQAQLDIIKFINDQIISVANKRLGSVLRDIDKQGLIAEISNYIHNLRLVERSDGLIKQEPYVASIYVKDSGELVLNIDYDKMFED